MTSLITNDPRPTVAPKEGHYAMLRNGQVIGPLFNAYPEDKLMTYELSCEVMEWKPDGTGHGMRPDYDIIATISPEAMGFAANTKAMENIATAMMEGSKSLVECVIVIDNLVKLADAVCDYADSHCRAFPIETAPKSSVALFHGFGWVKEDYTDENGIPWHYKDATHWSPSPRLELPDVFTQLGQALEKIKGAS